MASAQTGSDAQRVLLAARDAAGRARAGLRTLEALPPWRVLAVLAVVQWAAVVALARSVTHNGWIFYQGGDQLWYYTSGWLLLHGHIPQPLVGYGWSVVMTPLAAIFGANVASAMPAIVAIQFVVLLPLLLVTLYGIGERLGGRLWGYWLVVVWLTLPFVGIPYTNGGYHQRYTEVTLPQVFGLTGMADFVSLVFLAVSTYFVLRAVQGGTWFDGVAAGLSGGYAIGVKPSNSLYLAGVVLAYAAARKPRAALWTAAGLAPEVLALSIWKYQGYHYLPLLHASETVRLAAGAGPVVALSIHKYVSLDWHALGLKLDQLREHFWSGRLIEWAVIAGIVGLARRSRPAALLAGTWYVGFVIVKGAGSQASVDDSNLLRIMIPSGAAFLLLIASLPLLLPGAPRRLASRPPATWGSHRARVGVVAVCVVLFALVPAAITLAAAPLPANSVAYSVDGIQPVPVDPGFRVTAAVHGGRVTLSWPAQRPGSRMFYRVLRSPSDKGPQCSQQAAHGAFACELSMPVAWLGWRTTATNRPPTGTWTYRIAACANWNNDLHGGDAYLLSPPVTVTVRRPTP